MNVVKEEEKKGVGETREVIYCWESRDCGNESESTKQENNSSVATTTTTVPFTIHTHPH